jgi:hypothetical protein
MKDPPSARRRWKLRKHSIKQTLDPSKQVDPEMRAEAAPHFDDPRTVARYIGETVGTHYSAALRAADAYGKHLASARESLLRETFEGEGLGRFWSEVMRSEHVRGSSPAVHSQLATATNHYFADFLDAADAAFGLHYKDCPDHRKKKLGHTQHAQCLRLLRDHVAEGNRDHFAVRNRVATWIQTIRVMGGYQD